ncbi:uncharacterized protein IL334_006423 [Kwoniella shivajii]|uniref:ABC1 atypical kinase-like domain-containing protein n=1 Tax=Kwoniella shivajii TaxID=564305 RepID=A0ABZ1D749_9TREE|nr:hypothetical protein IL334_006423 [Kwoniella shivajii]
MLSAAIRVIARSATIQLEEIAALSATSSNSNKGKGKAVDQPIETLTESSERCKAEYTGSTLTAHLAEFCEDRLSPLDRLIHQAPRSPPPPAPPTHPDRHIEAEQSRTKGISPSAPAPVKRYKPMIGNSYSKPPTTHPPNSVGSSLDELIRNSPRTPPPPAPSTHPDRHIEAELSRNKRKDASSSTSSITLIRSNIERQRVEKEKKINRPKPKSIGDKGGLSLDQLIRNSPHTLPPAAPSTHPDRKIEKESATKPGNLEPIPKSSPPPQEVRPDVMEAVKPNSETPKPLEDVKSDMVKDVNIILENSNPPKEQLATSPLLSEAATTADPIDTVDGIENLGADPTTIKSQIDEDDIPVVLRASKVPSSRLGRLFHYGSLAASLSIGAASESIRRTTGGTKNSGSVFMSDANIRRLVATLGRMRGAALKLGQFMSIQDNHMLPPEIEKVLQQVQAHANYMPDWQMEKVMREEFGSEWQSLFSSFDRTPIASASIGQVHRATLASDSTAVAVKIQFPGVASSIESDLNNLSLLLRSSALLPKGLYLQNTIAVMRRELQDECDYVKEASAGRRFEDFLKDDTYFDVPKVIEEATTGKILTTQWMDGKPLSRVKGLSQETRDRIGTNILRLCLMELFQFRFMQTDPNWANFLYTTTNSVGPNGEGIQLIDFGASREYTKEFMDGWYRLLKSCLEGDRVKMKEESLSLGYLTGEENDVMVEAHLDSMALVASPFSYPGKYPFAQQTITDSIRGLIPIMLKHRLTPPPQETYSLNRKLSGAFLMCAKLGANVDCTKLWEDVVGGYKEG